MIIHGHTDGHTDGQKTVCLQAAVIADESILKVVFKEEYIGGQAQVTNERVLRVG